MATDFKVSYLYVVTSINNNFIKVEYGGGIFTPKPLTEPYVNLSIHVATGTLTAS